MDIQRATPVRAIRGESRHVRGRGLLILLAVLVLVAVAGVAWLGLNPPGPVPKPVEKVIPNDKFQVR